MPALPPVEQIFTVQASQFLAGVNEMLAEVERLATAIDEVSVASDRLAGAADVAAGADERLSAAEQLAAIDAERQAAAIDALVASCEETVAAADGAAAAIDRETVALGEQGKAAEDSAGKTSAFSGGMKTAFLGIAAATVYSIVKASEYQTQMTKLLTQAGVAKSQFAALSSGTLALAGQVGFSPTSLAQSLFHVESSFGSVGISAKQALDIMKTGAEGARVGGSDLVETQNALDAAVVSGIQGVQNYGQAMGQLNAIVGQGDMTMQDLVESMGTGIMASAKLYGQSLTEVGAALDVFGDNNIRGAKAATDLRMTWQAIEAPMATGKAALQSIGLTSNTLANTLTHHGLTAALAQFVQHLKDSHVPMSDWGQMITEIFGKKAGAGIGVLTENLSRLQGKFKPLQDGANKFGQAWADTQKTVGQQWAQLKSGSDALAVSFGSILLPAATAVMGVLNKGMSFLTQHKELAAFAGAMLAVAVGFKVAAAAESIFDAVTDANPVMLVILAVIALAAGLYELYKHFKIVRDALHDVAHGFDDFRHFVAAAAHDVAHVFDVVRHTVASLAHDVAHVFDDIKSAISRAIDAVVGYVRTHWKLLVAIILGPLGIIIDILVTHWAAVKHGFQAAWDFCSAVVRKAVAVIVAIVTPFLDGLVALFRVAWSVIESVFRVAWSIIGPIVMGGVNGVRAAVSWFAGLAAMFWGWWEAAARAVNSAISTMISFVESIPGRVNSALGGLPAMLFNAGVNAINGLINGILSGIGALGSVMGNIASKVAGFIGLSPAKEGPLSGSGSPKIRGQHIAADIAAGMLEGGPLVAAAMQHLAGSAGLLPGGAGSLAVGGGGAAGGGAGGTAIGPINLTVNGFVGNQQELMQALYYQFQKIVLIQDRRNVTNGLSLAHP